MNQHLRPAPQPGRPALPRASALEASGHAIAVAKDRLAAAVMQGLGPDRIELALAEAKGLARAAAELRADIARGAVPASDDVIETALGMLVRAYPNVPKETDIAGYGALLSDDVCSLGPSAFAVHAGCEGLRRRSRFLPSIAEVLAAIEAAEALAARADRQALDLEHWIERARKALGHG